MNGVTAVLILLCCTYVTSLNIVWHECPLFTNKIVPEAPKAECASISVPLNHDQPSREIQVFVKRTVASPSATKSLWLFEGGPGSPSITLEPIVHTLDITLESDFNFYMIEHRGVGRSTRLGCEASQAESVGSDGGATITMDEMPSCFDDLKKNYGNETISFSSINAARDAISIIKHEKELYNKQHYLFGISYGTMLVTRIMQVADKDLISGVVMDSVVSTTAPANNPNLIYSFDQWDTQVNNIGLRFLDRCGQDGACSSKLTITPRKFIDSLFTKLFKSNSCPDITDVIDSIRLKSTLAKMLMNPDHRDMIPALLYRLNRCDIEQDVPSLNHMFKMLDEIYYSPLPEKPLDSIILFQNIIFSELWNRNTTLDQLLEVFDSTFFSNGYFRFGITQNRTSWTLYDVPESLYNTSFTTTKPVLLMNGLLDAQTPIHYARQQFQSIQSPDKALIETSNGVHIVVLNSVVTDSKLTCGMQILVSFLKNNSTKLLDTSCLQNLVKIDFSADDEKKREYFGTNDAYDGFYQDTGSVAQVNIYLFIGVYSATLLVIITVICLLLYNVMQVKKNQRLNSVN